MPIHIIKDINSCLRAARSLRQEFDKEPSTAEIARQMDRDVEDVERLMALHNRVTIRAGNSNDETAPVDRLQAKRDAEPARCAQKDAVRRMVDQWVGQLDEKQREVVDRRFGLHGYRRASHQFQHQFARE